MSFHFRHNSEGFGHYRTDSKLEPAVDSAADSAVDSVVDLAEDGGYSESTDSHTELPEDIAIIIIIARG